MQYTERVLNIPQAEASPLRFVQRTHINHLTDDGLHPRLQNKICKRPVWFQYNLQNRTAG